MAQNRSKFNLIGIFLKEVKAGIDNCVETIQDGRLANYVLKELEKKRSLYSKDYFALPTVDHLIQKYGFDHVDIVNMDVQGAEYKVMLGAAESVKDDLIDYLLIGIHRREFNDALRELLSPKFDLIVDIYRDSVGTVGGFPPIRCHDGIQLYKRKNL